jgi:fatty acid desaturase
MEMEARVGERLARDTVRRLSRRSDSQGLLQLGLHIGLLCATGLVVWMSRGHPWLVSALVLQGIVLCFLFCALHESIHRTAFASRWLNDLVAWICGAWVFPAVLGQPFLRLFLLAEHSGCAFSDDMLENTRTTHTNAVTRRLAWWMPYHAEHHSFPSVPFHALPELHALMGQRVRVTASGYFAVQSELLRRLRAARGTHPHGEM